MGTVYARGKWLWLGFIGPDGKRYMRSAKLPVGREAEAHAKLAELETAIAQRAASAPPPLTRTVATWAAEWSRRRIAKGKHTNAKLDESALQRHVVDAELSVHGTRVVLGRLRLEEVRVLHVRAWLETMEAKHLAPNTVLSIYSLMNRMFRSAVREELLDASPCNLDRGELPQLGAHEAEVRPEDSNVFTLRELERLVSDRRIPLDRRLCYGIAGLGGLREGDLSALTWADYDATIEPLGRLFVSKSYTRRNKRVKGTKSGVVRWVPTHPVAASLLAEWRLSGFRATFGRAPRTDDLLVPNRAGRHMTDLNLLGNLQADLKALGMRPRTFHALRATFCTYAAAGGATWDVAKHISHGVKRRSRNMANVYVRPPWEVLCSVVLGIKLAPQAEAQVLPLLATGTGALHSGATFDRASASTTQPDDGNSECPGRDSNPSASLPPRVATSRNSTFADAKSRQESPEAEDCSASATLVPALADLLELGSAALDPQHPAMKRAAEVLPKRWRAPRKPEGDE